MLPSRAISNAYVLLSDQMVQHKNALNRQATIGYARFLISLNFYEFLQPYSVALDVNNYDLKNSKVIEEFERIVIKHSDEFEAS